MTRLRAAEVENAAADERSGAAAARGQGVSSEAGRRGARERADWWLIAVRGTASCESGYTQSARREREASGSGIR